MKDTVILLEKNAMPDRISHQKPDFLPDHRSTNDYYESQNFLAPDSVIQLGELKVGQVGWIVSINTKQPESMHELSSMGISPHAAVRMLVNYGSHAIFRVNGKKFVADKEIAAGIWVQPV